MVTIAPLSAADHDDYWLTAETNGRARALYDRVSTRTGMIHYQITPA